jgi:hypothetical protein
MSHLQQKFIAKAKAQMHQKPQQMTHGVLVREATRIYPKHSKPGTMFDHVAPAWWRFEFENNKPDYLRFTLKK